MSQQSQVITNNQLLSSHPSTNCRREYQDRRQHPTPLLSKYTFVGSRRKNRRQGDQCHNYYVDIYNRKLVGFILLIFSLCTLDAILTLILLGQGASELNPIMDYYLKLGGDYFLTFKLFSTSVGLLVLLIHQNFKRVQKIIGSICVFYGLLVTYQLGLLVVLMAS